MNMHVSDEQLCAYLDNELDATARAEVERALQQDAQLSAKLAAWSGQAGNLRAALDSDLNDPLPAAWLELARAPATAKAKPAALRVGWSARILSWLPAPRYATGLALAAVLGIMVGHKLMPRFNMDGQLVRLASVAHHVYSPDKRQPVEVKADDPTLTAWISKRLRAKVSAPLVEGFRFMGGRLLAGAEEPAAQFMYEDTAGKRLTVFVRTEGATGRNTAPDCDGYRGVSVCYWYADGVAYALAGEVDQARLSALAQSAAISVRAAPAASGK
jgi:anti-sigma factor RsiW